MEVLNIDIDFFHNCQQEGGVSIAFEQNTKIPAEIISITSFENNYGVNRIPFSVIFIVKDTTSYWPQDTYTIHTKDGKYASVFLVPIGPSPEGMQYEAIFA